MPSWIAGIIAGLIANLIANLEIYLQPTTLFDTLVILTLLVGGLGLIARSLRPVGRGGTRYTAAVYRGTASIALFLLGCGANTPSPAPAPVATPAPTPQVDLPIRTCSGAFAPQPLDVHDVAPLAVAGGKRWLVARRGDTPVLLHLDRAGRPAEVELPRYGEVAAQEGEKALRMVWTTAPLEWLRIDLGDRDRPVVGPSAPIPGLKGGEYPKAVASDGAVVLVSVVRDEPGVDGPRSVSETVLLDATTGQRIGEAAALLVWRAHCQDGRCFGAVESGTPSIFSLVEFSAGGVRTLESFGTRDCSGLFAWVDKAQWRVAWARRGSAMTAAVDLKTGAVTTTEVPGQERVCGPLSRINADGSFASDPDSEVDVGDGFVSHMFDAHSPSDGEGKPSGPLRFFGHWSYRRHGDDWKDAEPHSIDEDAPIAAAPGSRVLWLARPGAVGVVFTGGDGVPATYLPLRAACPSVEIPTRPEPS